MLEKNTHDFAAENDVDQHIDNHGVSVNEGAASNNTIGNGNDIHVVDLRDATTCVSDVVDVKPTDVVDVVPTVAPAVAPVVAPAAEDVVDALPTVAPEVAPEDVVDALPVVAPGAEDVVDVMPHIGGDDEAMHTMPFESGLDLPAELPVNELPVEELPAPVQGAVDTIGLV